MKPSWNDATEWANYLAQNYDGQWCWYQLKPSISYTMGYFFAELGGEWEEATLATGWCESLEQRPSN